MKTFNISDYLLNNRVDKYRSKRIHCEDGFTISVQAGEWMYCSPKTNDGPWTMVECGYPSEKVPELMEWADEEENPTKTVYGYVPVGVVEGVIRKHGGVKVTSDEEEE